MGAGLQTIKCSGCGREKPATREYFGSAPGGTLRRKCRECVRDYTSRYGEANKAAQARRNRQRIARGGHLQFSEEERLALLDLQEGYCVCCGDFIDCIQDAELDHVTPVVKGGPNVHWNTLLVHAQCNAEKHGKALDEHWAWRRKVGLPADGAYACIGEAARFMALLEWGTALAIKQTQNPQQIPLPLAPAYPRNFSFWELDGVPVLRARHFETKTLDGSFSSEKMLQDFGVSMHEPNWRTWVEGLLQRTA